MHLLLTIMSSLAQEESDHFPKLHMGSAKLFGDGKVTVPFKRFLGYDATDHNLGNPEQPNWSSVSMGCSFKGYRHFRLLGF